MKLKSASLNLRLWCVSGRGAPIESPTFTSGSRAWTKIKRIVQDPQEAYRGSWLRKNTDLGDNALFSLGPTQSPGTLNHSHGLSLCLLGNNPSGFLGPSGVREGWREMPGRRSALAGVCTHLHVDSHTPCLKPSPHHSPVKFPWAFQPHLEIIGHTVTPTSPDLSCLQLCSHLLKQYLTHTKY